MIPLWILCNPRSGSSYLCNVLNRTGLFPDYKNPLLNSTLQKPTLQLDSGRAFSEWLRVWEKDHNFFKQNPPPFTKCLRDQYLRSSLSKREIIHTFPGIKFVLLKRQNLLEQAVSLYFAKKTNIWHVFDKQELNDYLTSNIQIDHKLLQTIYTDVLSWQNNWDDFLDGSEFILYYEDMMNNPTKEINKLLSWYGTHEIAESAVEKEKNDPTNYGMTRPERSQVIELLTKIRIAKFL